MEYRMIITNLGRAKIAAALANNSQLNLSEMSVGDGAGVAVEPSETQTALVREVYRAGINSLTLDPVNPAYAVAELVIPTSVGGWTMREMGVWDNAGNLVAVGNVAPSYKPVAEEGSTREMILRAIIEVGRPDAVNLLIDPTVVMATRQYVDDKTNLGALLPGGTAGMVLTKKTNQDGDVEWKDLGDGITVLVDAREERQDLAAGQTLVLLNTLTTAGLAVYLDGVRLTAGVDWTVVNTNSFTLNNSPAGGEKLLAVQNNPAGALGFLKKEENLADLPDKPAARDNLGLSDTQIRAICASAFFPVGHVLFTTNSANPASYIGTGTWELYAQGRTIFGFQSSDSDFNTSNGTGGAKTQTLTINNLPAHTHSTPAHSLTTGSAGAHVHELAAKAAGEGGGGAQAGGSSAVGQNWVTETKPAGAHTHSVNIPASVTGSTGSGQAFSKLPPYVVTYIWRRTA